jgi:broad specificity phosphatase PhoE
MKKISKSKGRVSRRPALEPLTTIYLIRHCQPDYSLQKKLGDANMPLSRNGRRQADYLAEQLKKLGVQVIYSSAMERSLQTAAAFARHKKGAYEVREDLNEFDWGFWYRVKYFDVLVSERGRRIKKKEEMRNILSKKKQLTKKVLADIIDKNPGKTVAVFTHGNFIRALLMGILDADIFGFLSLEIFQASVSKLIIDRQGNVVVSYINDVSHLPRRPIIDQLLSALKH